MFSALNALVSMAGINVFLIEAAVGAMEMIISTTLTPVGAIEMIISVTLTPVTATEMIISTTETGVEMMEMIILPSNHHSGGANPGFSGKEVALHCQEDVLMGSPLMPRHKTIDAPAREHSIQARRNLCIELRLSATGFFLELAARSHQQWRGKSLDEINAANGDSQECASYKSLVLLHLYGDTGWPVPIH
jgi:hypothetical protein